MPLTPAGGGKWKAYPGGPSLPSKAKAEKQAAAIKINQAKKKNLAEGPLFSVEEIDVPFPSYEPEEGRVAIWMKVLAEPGFVHKGKYWEVDEDFIDNQMAAFKAYTRDGKYQPPVRIEHKAQGGRKGDILGDAKAVLKDGKLYYLVAAHLGQELSEMYRKKELRYFSPGLHAPVEDEFGVIHPVPASGAPFVLTEHSVVDAPHQKTVLGTTHLLSEESMDYEEKGEEKKEEMGETSLAELAETVKSLSESMAPMKQLMETLMSEDEEEREEGEEMAEDEEMGEGLVAAQMAEMRKQSKKMEQRLQMAERLLEESRKEKFEAEVTHLIQMREGGSLSMRDEAVQAALYVVAEHSPETFEKLLSGITPERKVRMGEGKSFPSLALNMSEGAAAAPKPKQKRKRTTSPAVHEDLREHNIHRACDIQMSEMKEFDCKTQDEYWKLVNEDWKKNDKGKWVEA